MSHSEKVAIVGGGRLSKKFLPEIIKSDYIIGVDRGAYWLVTNGVIPTIAIGDFDSVSAEEFQLIKRNVTCIKEHPKQKDATDMELAVDHAISIRPKEVVIYGAVGSRLDHTMGNIHLLERLGDIGVIRDANNEVRLVSGKLVLSKKSHYPYVSLLPITETIEVTLSGFFYDGTRAVILRGQTLGVSNEIRTEKATIEVHRGKALVMRSRD